MTNVILMEGDLVFAVAICYKLSVHSDNHYGHLKPKRDFAKKKKKEKKKKEKEKKKRNL